MRIANATIQAIQNQQYSLNSWAKLKIDNQTAFSYLLAEQSGICVIAKILLYIQMYVHNSGKVEKIYAQMEWLSAAHYSC